MTDTPLVRRSALTVVVVAALAASLVPGAASSAGEAAVSAGRRPTTPELIERAVGRGAIPEARGALYLTWAFTAPDRVPDEYVSRTPWSGTLPLLRLRERLARLGTSPAAVAARASLRSKTFACPGTTGSLPHRKATAHFYLQYKAAALRGLAIGKYATALETAWKTEIGRFRWPKPPRDPVSTPPGGRYPVRVENLGEGLYGYVAGTRVVGNNPATPWNDRDSIASCMVLNRDYRPFPGSPLDALRATVAHEFYHSIQFGYGALTGFGNVSDVMIEGLATWVEDEVFDSSDDSYSYLWPEFAMPMGRYTASPYPYWVVFRAMVERFGDGKRNGSEAVYQAFWEQISKGTRTNLAAMGRAFKTKRTTLAAAYHNASIALRFLVDCTATPRKYCLEEGPRYRNAAGSNHDHEDLGSAPDATSRSIANDLALAWIGLPTGGAPVTLTVTHDGGKGVLRVSVACRTGAAVIVTPAGSATASKDAVAPVDTAGCDEATVVVSNVKQTSPTPSSVTTTSYTVSIA